MCLAGLCHCSPLCSVLIVKSGILIYISTKNTLSGKAVCYGNNKKKEEGMLQTKTTYGQ